MKKQHRDPITGDAVEQFLKAEDAAILSGSCPKIPDVCPACGEETHTEYFTDGQNSTQIQPEHCPACGWTQGDKLPTT